MTAKIRIAISVTLCLCLLTLRGKNLAAAALNNGISLALRYWWPQVWETTSAPGCREQLEAPGSGALLQWALRLAPSNERAWLSLGRVAWLAGHCQEATEVWARAIALVPQDRIAWLLYTIATGGKGIHPDPTVARDVSGYIYRLGDQARGQKEWEKALQWYAIAFTFWPEAKGAGRLESVYLKLKRREEAIALWEELAALKPESDPDHWWALGRAAELTGEWGEAAYAYGRGARLAEDPYGFLMRQGYAYGRLRAWSQAELAYRRAVDVRPGYFWPYLSVGHMRRNQKDYEGALEWYRKAETLAPKRLEPRYYIGYAYYLQQDYATAQSYFRRALEINPKHVWSAYFLAQSLYKLGERDEAVEWLRSAVEWHSKHPWQWLVNLGDWLAEAGDKEGALAAYRQALEQRPGDEGIHKKIQALRE